MATASVKQKFDQDDVIFYTIPFLARSIGFSVDDAKRYYMSELHPEATIEFTTDETLRDILTKLLASPLGPLVISITLSNQDNGPHCIFGVMPTNTNNQHIVHVFKRPADGLPIPHYTAEGNYYADIHNGYFKDDNPINHMDRLHIIIGFVLWIVSSRDKKSQDIRKNASAKIEAISKISREIDALAKSNPLFDYVLVGSGFTEKYRELARQNRNSSTIQTSALLFYRPRLVEWNQRDHLEYYLPSTFDTLIGFYAYIHGYDNFTPDEWSDYYSAILSSTISRRYPPKRIPKSMIDIAKRMNIQTNASAIYGTLAYALLLAPIHFNDPNKQIKYISDDYTTFTKAIREVLLGKSINDVNDLLSKMKNLHLELAPL